MPKNASYNEIPERATNNDNHVILDRAGKSLEVELSGAHADV